MLSCALFILVAVKQVLRQDLDAVIYDAVLGLGVVLELYFAGMVLVLHSPDYTSVGIPHGIAAGVAVIARAIGDAGP